MNNYKQGDIVKVLRDSKADDTHDMTGRSGVVTHSKKVKNKIHFFCMFRFKEYEFVREFEAHNLNWGSPRRI